MTEWTIRPATADDAADLTNCIIAAYAEYRAQIPSLPDVSAGIEDNIRDNSVWVADAGGLIGGGVILILSGNAAKLANLAVHPDWRGLGLGRDLIAMAERGARDLGAPRLDLTTHVDMPLNLRLYERLGWQVTGQSGDKVHMSKSL